MNEDPILSTKEAAAYLGLAENTLRIWRHFARHGIRQTGPVSFRVGMKLVKYRKSDLDAWLEEQRAASLDEVQEARELAAA